MLLNFYSRIAYRIILAVMTTLLIGCTGDPDATFVDFSDRMVVDRSGDESRDKAYLKVAVGSIISAQETVVYYHQFLDECGWNKKQAALQLGISRNTLYRKLKKYQITPTTIH